MCVLHPRPHRHVPPMNKNKFGTSSDFVLYTRGQKILKWFFRNQLIFLCLIQAVGYTEKQVFFLSHRENFLLFLLFKIPTVFFANGNY